MSADLSSQKSMAIDAFYGKFFSSTIKDAYQEVYRFSLKSQKKLVPNWLTDARIEIAHTEAYSAQIYNEEIYEDTVHNYYANQEGE